MRQLCKIGKTCLNSMLAKQDLDRNVDRGFISKEESGLRDRLSRIQMQVLLYLHGLDVSSIGVIRRFDCGQAAEEIGCCIKTIWDALSVLNRRYYIEYSKIDSNHSSIFIINYKSYFNLAKSGGEGYVELTADYIKMLYKITQVNELRILLMDLLTLDAARLQHEKKVLLEVNYKGLVIDKERMYTVPEVVIDINEYKRRLPKYMNSVNKLKKLMESNELCNKKLEERQNSLYVSITLFNNYAKQKTELLNLYTESFQKDKIQFVIQFEPSQIDDIIQMSIQYGYTSVMEAIREVDTSVRYGKFTELTKLCGYIRNIIKKNILASESLLTAI